MQNYKLWLVGEVQKSENLASNWNLGGKRQELQEKSNKPIPRFCTPPVSVENYPIIAAEKGNNKSQYY